MNGLEYRGLDGAEKSQFTIGWQSTGLHWRAEESSGMERTSFTEKKRAIIGSQVIGAESI